MSYQIEPLLIVDDPYRAHVQNIFNKVATHLLTQNEKAFSDYRIDEDGNETEAQGCMYRTIDGLKCAIGCLIDDAYYTPDIEDRQASSTKVLEILAKSDADVHALLNDNGQEAYDATMLFLDSIQQVHDRAVSPDQWRNDLIHFAQRYGLDPNTAITMSANG